MILPVISFTNNLFFTLDAEQRIIFTSSQDISQNNSTYQPYVTSLIPDFPPPEHFIANSLSYFALAENKFHLYIFYTYELYYCYLTSERLLISPDVSDTELESTYNIINHSFDGITINDCNGRLLFANEAYAKLCGVNINEHINFYCQDFVKMKIIDKSVVSEVIKTRKRAFNISTFPKTEKVALVISTPIFDKQGKFVRVISNIRESRELYLAKEELAYHSNKAILINKNKKPTESFVYSSPQMQDIVRRSRQAAETNLNILITGETGSGKGVLAKYIHQMSVRRDFPFVKVNCAALPESLIESELFGYERGAFTGALSSGKDGLISAANNGILFLDEIGDLSYNMQAKLLDFLQFREFIKIGSTKSIKVDVHVIAATNQNLQQLIGINKFRKDLYYRLNVISFHIPPLRERQQDIRQLTKYFMKITNSRFNKAISMSDDVINAICKLPLHGNVRELEHLIQGLFVLTNSDTIILEDLMKLIDLEDQAGFVSSSDILHTTVKFESIDKTIAGINPCPEEKAVSYKELINNYELEIINDYLSKYGSVKNAAKVLKVHPSLIWRKLQASKCNNQ